MSEIQCPNCGSTKIQILNEACKGQLTLGPEFEYQAIIHQCQDCEEKGDFTGEGDARYLDSLKIARKALQKSLIEDLGNMGFTMAYIERTLELPQRTLARWKNGDLSAANLALLRIIRTMPWIVDVADHGYDQNYITAKMLSFIAEKLSMEIQANGYTPSAKADLTDPNSIRFELKMDKKPSIDPAELIVASSRVNLAG